MIVAVKERALETASPQMVDDVAIRTAIWQHHHIDLPWPTDGTLRTKWWAIYTEFSAWWNKTPGALP